MEVRTQGTGIHVCQIPGCTASITRRHLMCAPHWFDVPLPLRTRVFETLQAWTNGEHNVRPYLLARLNAILAVCELHKIDCADLEAQQASLVEMIRLEAKGRK